MCSSLQVAAVDMLEPERVKQDIVSLQDHFRVCPPVFPTLLLAIHNR